MAISQNTLIGSTSQSVGGVTFTKWKGRNVIKAKAISVANPRTPAQTANRNRFAGVSKFYSEHKTALSLAFLRLMGNVTDGNMFNSMNRLCFSTDFVGIDPAKIEDLTLSSGSLGSFGTVSNVEGMHDHASVAYTYTPNPAKALATDQCRVLVYNETKDTFAFSDQTVAEGSANTIVFIGTDSGDVVYAWVYSFSITGRLLSDSVYCGSFIATA